METFRFFILISVLFVSTFSFGVPSLAPSANGKPPVTPPITIRPGTNVIFNPTRPSTGGAIILKERPIFQIGDWNSSGTPEMPYEPEFEYQYNCQAQITDDVTRQNGEGASARAFRFYAVADFQLNNQASALSTKDLKWFGFKYYSVQDIVDTDAKIPFAVDNNFISVRFRGHQDPSQVPVFFTATLNQKIRGLEFSDSSTRAISRETNSVSFTVSLNVRDLKNKSVPRMSMRILCSKEK